MRSITAPNRPFPPQSALASFPMDVSALIYEFGGGGTRTRIITLYMAV